VALLVRVFDVATDIPPKLKAAAKPVTTILIVRPFDELGKGVLEQRCVGACGDGVSRQALDQYQNIETHVD
jgi:hypothetical protein